MDKHENCHKPKAKKKNEDERFISSLQLQNDLTEEACRKIDLFQKSGAADKTKKQIQIWQVKNKG